MQLVARTIVWSNNYIIFLLRGYPCYEDTRTCAACWTTLWMYYAMRDVKDMGQHMGYCSLQWNWPKEAMNRPIWAGIFDVSTFELITIS